MKYSIVIRGETDIAVFIVRKRTGAKIRAIINRIGAERLLRRMERNEIDCKRFLLRSRRSRAWIYGSRI